MRATDIMSRPVYTVRPTDTVELAAALLAEKQITAAPVVDGAGDLVGMVSEGDLLWHRVPADPTAHHWRASTVDTQRPKLVAEVMSRRPFVAGLATDVADIAELMLDHDVRSVPIVEEGEVVGIVSRRDILRSVVRTDDVLCQEVQHRLDEYAGGTRRWSVTVVEGSATVGGDFDDEAERAIVAVMARSTPGIVGVRVPLVVRR